MDEILAYLRNTFPGLEFERGESLYAKNPIQFQWARYTGSKLYYCSDKAAWNEVPRSMYQGMYDRPLARRKESIVASKEAIKEASERGETLARLLSSVFQVQESIENPMDVMDLGWEFSKIQGIQEADMARAYSTAFGSFLLKRQKSPLLLASNQELKGN